MINSCKLSSKCGYFHLLAHRDPGFILIREAEIILPCSLATDHEFCCDPGRGVTQVLQASLAKKGRASDQLLSFQKTENKVDYLL